MKIWAAAGLWLAVFLLPVWADDLDASVQVLMHESTGDIDRGTKGKGKETVTAPTFTVKLSNTGMDDMPNITLKLYVAVAHNWIRTETEDQRQGRIQEILEGKASLPAGASQEVEMGSVEVKSSVTGDSTHHVTWFGGAVYQGYVLEIYSNGALYRVKVGGNTAARRAYDEYKKNTGGDTAGAKESPAP
ncbi:MAG: hypothetical protein PW734_07330 [Verrucomicrobium sp.]|nr:hypothetical protein [Verrucomicrobium sp.]